jgi:hypothetical protein
VRAVSAGGTNALASTKLEATQAPLQAPLGSPEEPGGQGGPLSGKLAVIA